MNAPDGRIGGGVSDANSGSSLLKEGSGPGVGGNSSNGDSGGNGGGGMNALSIRTAGGGGGVGSLTLAGRSSLPACRGGGGVNPSDPASKASGS